jgi:hypothetical protein
VSAAAAAADAAGQKFQRQRFLVASALPVSQLIPFYQSQLILASICLALLTGMGICFALGIWRSHWERRVW